MEPLNWLEWGAIETPIELEIIDHGVLPKNINFIEISRDKNLGLTAVGRGFGEFSLEEIYGELRAGESIEATKETLAKSEIWGLAKLKGLIIQELHTKGRSLLIDDSTPLFIEIFVDEIEFLNSNFCPLKHVEWIINFDIGDYRPKGQTRREYSTYLKRKRFDENWIEVELSSNGKASFDYFKCDFLINADKRINLIAGYVPDSVATKTVKPGFLEFEETDNSFLPTEFERQKILAALSFVLGRNLTSVGNTVLGEGDRRCSSKTFWADAKNFVSDNLNKHPSPLDFPQLDGWLDNEYTSFMIGKIVSKMNEIDIEYSLYLLWTGWNAPMNVRAFYLGAAIESLRDSYLNSVTQNSGSLIRKSTWKDKFDKPLMSLLDQIQNQPGLYLNSDERENLDVIRNKIKNLNQKSSNMKYSSFFEALDLSIGPVESEALKERNRAAHGHRYRSSEYHRLSMNVEALYSLFARLILRITEASNFYIDYSTYGHPIRRIYEPLGGPQGNGRPA